MKTCIACKLEKEIEEFSWKSQPKGIRQSRCKKCYRSMRNKWYIRNKQQEIDTVVAYRLKKKKELRKWFWEYKSTLKCQNCGEARTPTLQFHHLNSKDKEITLSKAVTDLWPIKKIMEEIAKCDVLCANCHAIEHYNQRNGELV